MHIDRYRTYANQFNLAHNIVNLGNDIKHIFKGTEYKVNKVHIKINNNEVILIYFVKPEDIENYNTNCLFLSYDNKTNNFNTNIPQNKLSNRDIGIIKGHMRLMDIENNNLINPKVLLIYNLIAYLKLGKYECYDYKEKDLIIDEENKLFKFYHCGSIKHIELSYENDDYCSYLYKNIK